MVHINIGNLKRTDRPLTWLPEPTCDGCALPFTYHADELYNRLPLLLSCKHLLCGLCVREHSLSDSIPCERCNKLVSLPGSYENVSEAFQPSYYMLGMMAQMQQELKNIELYYEGDNKKAKHATPMNKLPKDFPIESILASEISSTKKMKGVLERVYDAYEKAKHALDRRSQSYPENVDQVIQQINAHFLTLHNALQIEQDRALQLVRKTYLEQHQHIEYQQHHLLACKNRLLDMHARLRKFHNNTHRPDDQSWLKFRHEVQTFLEREPLKLAVTSTCNDEKLAVCFTDSEKCLKTISSSYKLTLSDLSKTVQLVPFTASKKKQRRTESSVVDTSKKEGSDARERKLSDRSKHHDSRKTASVHEQPESVLSERERKLSDRSKHHESRKTVGVKEQTTPVPVYSERERKLSDRSKHHESSTRKVILFDEQTVPSREQKYAEASVIHGTSGQQQLGRDNKRSRSGLISYEPRVSKEVDNTILKECFSTVNISCVVNPHEIYVRDDLYQNTIEQITELCQEEADNYEQKLLSGKCAPLHVQVGAHYLVQPSISTSWYRARVLEVLSPAAEQCGPYNVQFLDFGGKDTVEHDQLRPISDDLMLIGCRATRCSLHSIVPPGGRSETSWPAECYQLMMDFIGNRKMLMYELDSTSDCKMVDLFLPPIKADKSSKKSGKIDALCWDGYYPPMSLRTMLIHFQQCIGVEADLRSPQSVERLRMLKNWLRQAAERSKKRCSIPRAPTLTEYDFFAVHVTHSQSPDHFYIMPMEWKTNSFDKLQEQLNMMCQQANEHKVFCPYEGLVCGFALDTQDSDRVWLRGRIESILPGSCRMFALDTGESLKVRCSDLYLFSPESAPLSVYPLAVCCSLEHIRPKNVGAISAWHADVIEEFNMLMKCKTLQFAVTIGSLWKESKVYSVLLYMRNKSNVDTCVNKMLVAQGHAECIAGREAQIDDLVHKPDIRKASEEEGPAPATSAPAEATVSKVVDPRVPVDLLRVITPAEFYVRLSSRKADLDGLHHTIQQHMEETLDGDGDRTHDPLGQDADKSDWCPGDICLVFTTPSDEQPIEWYRARITDVQEEGELYEAFLIDRAVTVQVHRTNMARMVPRIAQLQPGAIRCQLACIEPLKGTDGWQKVTVDGLNNIIDTYQMHAISLDAKLLNSEDDKQSLSVVLWGVRVLAQQALAPQRTEYRNINQLLVMRGLAHSSGRFRTFPTKGNGALEELQSVEKAVEQMMRREHEKLQQFFRAIAAVSAEAEGFGAPEDGNETAEIVLNGAASHTTKVAIDGACAAILMLVSDKVEPITDWPMSVPIEKTVFVGMPTHVGNDGTVFLYDMCQEPVLHRIRDTIQEYIANCSLSASVTDVFQPGEPCLAQYHLDGLFYRGTIVTVIKRNKYRVLFVDYGNEEICQGEDLRKDIVCGRVPVQTNRFWLCGLVPAQPSKKGLWPEIAIITCHGLIVQKLCTVRVDTSIWSPNHAELDKVHLPLPCKLYRLNDSVDVYATLLELGHFKACVEKNTREETGRIGASGRSVSSRNSNSQYLTPDAILERCRRTPSPCTPEQRDLMQFVQEMDSTYNFDSFHKEYEDPNELPEEPDDESECLNRAQELDIEDADHNDASSECSATTIQSPSSFNPNDLDSSTRFSAEEEFDVQPNLMTDFLTDPLARSSFSFVSPIDRKRTSGFFANFTSYGSDLTLHVYPHIEGHSLRFERMTVKIQRIVKAQTELLQWQASLLEVGAPCLAPYAQDGRYYRAIIDTVYEDRAEVGILYVDYLNRATIAVADLRKCPKELRTIPLRNVEVRLKGVRRNPRIREADIGRRMMEVLSQPFYVRIVPPTSPPEPGETYKPEVELFSDYERGILAYETMINERYLNLCP
uniref:Tudor domain-containing protein n=1 Tax=Anopheles culicifacies TaxID=139723 RepID=A0A182M2D3_9DIPT